LKNATGINNIQGQIKNIDRALKGLALYRHVRKDPVVAAFEQFIAGLLDDKISPHTLLDIYGQFLNRLINDFPWGQDGPSWSSYWGYCLLRYETVFSRQAEFVNYEELPSWLKDVMEYELGCIRQVAKARWDDILDFASYRAGFDEWFNPFGPYPVSGDKGLKNYHTVVDWGARELARHFHRCGSGVFGMYKAFRWERVNGQGCLKAISDVDPITLDELVGYEEQKARIIENTEQLLKGYQANNVLLYGDKGTGKSSLVKALIHRYGDRGLRLVEVPKDYLVDYYKILEQLEGRKQKFVLFVDDLSFEEDEVEYKHIKALLEGGIKTRPSNVVVYATSNRRHIVREFHHDRNAEYGPGQEQEVFAVDSLQEKLSLADRFGITLTFVAPNQRTYLEMVEALARQRRISVDADKLREEALRWEKKYNGRSGRTARQFIDYMEARLDN
jgi:predicted AAA+ superfamily ATPase